MASFIPNSLLRDEATGLVDFDDDDFKVMLVAAAAAPSKDTWATRANVTNEVTGTGYTAGGADVTVTVGSVDAANDRVDITLGGATWPGATITARYAVYYRDGGGAASADPIIAVNDFGSDVTSTAADFVLQQSVYRKTNP